MNPVGILPACIATGIALLSTYGIDKITKAKTPPVQYESIDGLRGFLAFFVFLHHCSIWYFFLQSKKWEAPPSNLYVHFGETGTALFFMITGFLFFDRLVKSKQKKMNWNYLFVSRFMRLVPLYFFSMLVLFAIIFSVTDFTLHDSWHAVVAQVWQWTSFCIIGMPDINGFKHTFIVNGGVTWSLGYEWLFYFSLPLLSLFVFRRRVPLPVLLICGIVFGWIYIELAPNPVHFVSFGGGIAAALLSQSKKFRTFASRKINIILIMAAFSVAVIFFHEAYAVLPLGISAIAFVFIACGNNLFGVLSSQTARSLGKISYSIYLLHGILLFVIFKWVVGFETAAAMTPLYYWMVIFAAVVPLVLLSNLTYFFIERPGKNLTMRIVQKFEKRKAG